MGKALSLLRPGHPQPLGEHQLGCMRSRLPSVDGSGASGLYVQVHYPANLAAASLDVDSFPWFRPEVIAILAESQGVSHGILNGLLGNAAQLDTSAAPKLPHGDGRRWPIVVFSHGLWGSCEMYTQLCREIASHGAIVIAVEHEDGSASFAVNGETGEAIPYVKPPPDVDDATFRRPFLERRCKDYENIARAVKSMVAANAAVAPSSAADGTGKSHEASVALASVLGCGDPERVVLVGHSFGSSGALRYFQSLVDQRAPSPYCGAVLLDTWTKALPEQDTSRSPGVRFALLLSEGWGRDGSLKLASACGEDALAASVVKGTVHQWVSESGYFMPRWMLRKMKIIGPGEFTRAHQTTMKATWAAIDALCGGVTSPEQVRERFDTIDPEVLVPLLSV
eukprot:TRINITY_DN68268_c0_g1_i1.p1 TRINITY_DN68268_c0_g1~~TRINITY_DN68268_c0_g1_i1.p1  ORF type:complete len:395 (-),score=46.41 TRINITY_DN68268_c0_g1_i1:50-1234(-)